MKNCKTFQVVPSIPKPLQFIETLARNMWWCWNKDAIELFRRIEPALWVEAGRNPIFFLSKISQRRFGGHTNNETGKPVMRACHAADRTGHMILQTLYQQCRSYHPRLDVPTQCLS